MTASISSSNLETHLRRLTCDIGVRLPGSAAERRAADYVADEFRRSGAKVSVETFPMRQRIVKRQELAVRIGGRWRSFACSLFSSTPGTNGRTVEAPLVFLEAPPEYQRKDFSHLTGKAVVHLGCHIESRAAYRRLIEARPAFLMLVDIRYTGAVPLADGMFPAYARSIGAVPTVNVAFMDAWRWKAEGATAARLRVAGGMTDSVSRNVIADLPGRELKSELLILGAHHDTQADSVGADDNASGVAGLLEIARVLSPRRRKRTVRLISFGTEEQLSVGSAEYARRHRREIRNNARLMFNLDAYGSHLGWTNLVCNGSNELARFLASRFRASGLYVNVSNEIVPYADHFPFVAAGAPGAWLTRNNCASGRFFHHRPDDDMSRVSTPLMASLLDAVASITAGLSNATAMPFSSNIPKDQQAKVKSLWNDLFGGWRGTD